MLKTTVSFQLLGDENIDSNLSYGTYNTDSQPSLATKKVLSDFPHFQHRTAVSELCITVPVLWSILGPRWNFRKANWAALAQTMQKIMVWFHRLVPTWTTRNSLQWLWMCPKEQFSESIGRNMTLAELNGARSFLKWLKELVTVKLLHKFPTSLLLRSGIKRLKPPRACLLGNQPERFGHYLKDWGMVVLLNW